MRSQQWVSRTVAAGLAAASLAVWTPGCNEGPTANNEGVGPEGGVVTSLDGRATLTIPAGALDRRIPITIRKVDDTQFLGDATYIGGTAYEVLPANLVFKKEVQLRIAFDAGNVPGDVTFDRLRIMDREQSAWSDEDCVYKGLTGNAVTAGMTHTNVFGVVAAPPVVGSVTVSPKTAKFEAGDQVQLAAVAKDGAGNPLNVTISWTSSNNAVATVAHGMVLGHTAGTVTITATAGAFSDVAEVTVHPKVVFIEILPFQSPLVLGTTLQLVARAEGPNDVPVAPDFVWFSNDLSVATVDQNGLVTPVGMGEVDITVNFKAVSATVEFLVVGPVASVTMSRHSAKFEQGDTELFAAEARDAAGTLLNEPIDWTSSDPSVATVANGLVYGVALGTATITATSGAFSDFAVVTVHPRVVFMEILPIGRQTVLLGTNLQLTARAEGPDEEAVEPAWVWTSSNPGVATVDQNGFVTTVGLGETDITVTFKAVKATKEIKVVGPPN